jgi:hypothetical protein
MRSKRTVVLGAVLAAFGLSAIAASAASAAAPEFFHCVAKTGGKFAAGCGKTGTGFEKAPVAAGSKIAFTGTVGPTTIYLKGEYHITCESGTSKGEVTGPKTTANIATVFTGCVAAEKKDPPCSARSEGKAAGEIALTTPGEGLPQGTLGKVAKAEAASEVGEASNRYFVELVTPCLSFSRTVLRGGVVGEITPVKTMQTTEGLTFSAYTISPPVQEIELFEGSTYGLSFAEGYSACLVGKLTFTFAEPIEVT